jgi:hypothetical protein
VNQLDPASGPTTILMSEQSHNMLMPLYADQREGALFSGDSAVLAFSYGARTIVVDRRWEWDGFAAVDGTLTAAASIPLAASDPSEPVLVVAGGWGSGLFARIPRLQSMGGLLEAVPVLGQDAEGEPLVRMMGLVIDRATLAEAR